MSHCVPSWDESSAAAATNNDFLDDLDEVRELPSSSAFGVKTSHHKPGVPPANLDDFSELIWTPDGDLVMQVHTGRSLKSTHWFAPCSELVDRDRDRDRPSRLRDDALNAVVSSSAAAAPPPTTFEEDDLISWLQYPDDGDAAKNDCSTIFNDPSPATTTNSVQVFRDSSPVIQPAQAQMLMGEARTDVPSTEAAAVVETTTTTTMSAPGMGSSAGPTQWLPSTKDALPLHKLPPEASVSTVSTSTTTPMLPPKPQKTAAAGTSLNFSHFSRPAVKAKANLHTLGKCSASISSHLQEQFKKNELPQQQLATPLENSVGSAGTARSAVHHQMEVQGQSSDVQQSLGSQQASWQSQKSPKSKREHKDAGPSSSAAMETNEQTFTSSDGSGNTTDKMKKKTAAAGKRAADEITECQSEDAEGESVEAKKPPAARTGAKRSRAAEVHNLSERRRRDRINEKMKALQELIPNSNKTDKASMLDEAIEYLKMLQLQLQMMSMRSGLSLPPMIIPSGMQHLQMPQVTAMPHVGMGMGMGVGLGVGLGMGMGMGVGLMDVNSAASVRAVMPLGQPLVYLFQPVEMYHAYILHQQQQQMQLQLQHQQHQQLPQQQHQPPPPPPPPQSSDQHKPGAVQ